MNILCKKKRVTVGASLAMFVVLLSLFLVPASPVAVAQEPVDSEELIAQYDGVLRSPADVIPGEILEGNYLRVGINPAGTLGISDPYALAHPWDPGIGFQWAGEPLVSPLLPSTESLATGWWGEGYKIAYKVWTWGGWVDRIAYYYPSCGWPPPPETRIELVSEELIRDDDNAAVMEIKVRTSDNMLLLTSTFTLLKEYPELNLETTIENLSKSYPSFLGDIVYTRIVDWDVCGPPRTDNWASTDHAAYAWRWVDIVGDDPYFWEMIQTVQLTVAGHDGVFERKRSLLSRAQIPGIPFLPRTTLEMLVPVVNYVDLWAWDDITGRKPEQVKQVFVRYADEFDADEAKGKDFNAGIYYKIGDLGYGDKATVYTVYQANFPPS